MALDILKSRRDRADSRLRELGRAVESHLALSNHRFCVYVTGSFGRGEASAHSDLDLFIVEREPSADGLVESRLLDVTRKEGFPDPSFDKYLVRHTVDALVKGLGRGTDDSSNTFTARLLLLLESRPVFGHAEYRNALDAVINAYWRDYSGHESDFLPAFLANDVLRLWRTFCVNYEARTDHENREERVKRRLKNYKLKHSRLLTCYSALCFLMVVHFEKGTVSPEDVREMVGLRPTERLEALSARRGASGLEARTTEILERYELFLSQTDASREELLAKFEDDERFAVYLQQEDEVGDSVYELLASLGKRNPKLFRILVV